MKWQVVLTVLGANSCWAAYDQQQMREYSEMTRVCYQKLGIAKGSDLWMRTIYNHDMTMNELEKRFIECGQQIMGWKDSEGNYYPERLIDFIARNAKASRQQVAEVVYFCMSQMHGETQVEVAVNLYQCCFATKDFDL